MIPRSRDAWRIIYAQPRCELARLQQDESGEWVPVGVVLELYGPIESVACALLCLARAYEPDAEGESEQEQAVRQRLNPYLR